MTRINCVPPSELSRQHLLAEYRELPRIFGLVERAIARGERPGQDSPDEYVLGRGHCRFFYSRLKYLADRHRELVREMLSPKRKLKPRFTTPLAKTFAHIPQEWWGDWRPDKRALQINRTRLRERNTPRKK